LSNPFQYKQHPQTGQQVLCISVEQFAYAPDGVGIPMATYKSLKQRKKMLVLGRGGNGNEAFIVYNSLPQEYQNKINIRFGDPQGLNQIHVLINSLFKYDHKAFDTYKAHRTESKRFLPTNESDLTKDWPHQLTVAASWMNLVNGIVNKTFDIPNQSYKEIRANEYQPLRQLLESNKVWLPYSYDKLMQKRKQFFADNTPNYTCLIPKNLENTNSLALNEEQLVLLKQIYGNAGSRQMDFTWIATKFNLVCVAKGWKLKNGKQLSITADTVSNYLNQYQKQLTVLRKGTKTHNKSFGIKQKKQRPTAPLYFVCHDGWTAELFYQKKVLVLDKKTGREKEMLKWWLRKTVVVVLDKFNDIPLGWAIGNEENSQLMEQAYLNAMSFVNASTGAYYLPWQIKSDNFGTKEFKSTMVKLTGNAEAVTPITVGNSNDNPIEAWFSWFNKKYCKEQPNWSGYNVTNGVGINSELIELTKHNLPTEEELIHQLNSMLETERNIRLEPWKKALEVLAPQDKRIVSREEYLRMFGQTTHYTLRGDGFYPSIAGQDYWFMALDHNLMDWIGSRFTLYYDTTDLSNILAVHPEERLSFIVPNMPYLPMAIKDETEESKLLNAQFNGFKRKQLNDVAKTNQKEFEQSVELLSNVNEAIDVAKLLPVIGGQQKQLLKQAQRALVENNINQGRSLYQEEGSMRDLED
jgi:hypothetical protein